MRLSQLFTKTSKESVADASSLNADLLVRAGYVHKTMAGVYSFLPLGLRVLRNIEQIVREEMDRIGGQELLLSALSPKEAWTVTGRWDAVDVLFKVSAADDSEYALNPTHEEIITPLAKAFVRSYRDLPFAAYQIQTKFRNEARAKSGIMRGREFLMKDLYSFHADAADLDRFYEVAQGAYDAVFDRLGIGDKTYLTYASGGTFSQYSHEYQVVLPSGEDTIYVSVEAEKQGKRIAINREIYEAGKTTCPVTGGTEFREERASEAGNIFKLSTKFSEPTELEFTDAEGKKHPVIMGCYGIGVSRLMGILVEAWSDKKGLVWSPAVSPFRVHVVTLAREEGEPAYAEALKIVETFEKKGITVLFDDRFDASAGVKFADAELLGLPTRIVLSKKTLEQGSVEVQDRRTGDVTMVKLADILSIIA